MKVNKLIVLPLVLLIPVLLLFLFSCSDNPLSNEATPDRISYTTDEINWISWQPGVIEAMKGLSLARGFEGKNVKRNKGGKVGGWLTFDNKVKIQKNALPADTYVSVDVTCVENDEQCGAQVEFLPSMQFDKDIKIELSWAWLDLDDDEIADFDPTVYWSDNGGTTWYVIDNVQVNYNKQTLKIRVDHFTIFAWGEAPPGVD